MEIPGFPEEVQQSQFFKQRGRNPQSGDFHYECPRCRMVLLVTPQDALLDESFITCHPVYKPGRTHREPKGLFNAMYH